MGFFKKLIRTGLDVALLPVAATQDAATMFGVLTERESYIAEKLGDIGKDIEKVRESLDD